MAIVAVSAFERPVESGANGEKYVQEILCCQQLFVEEALADEKDERPAEAYRWKTNLSLSFPATLVIIPLAIGAILANACTGPLPET